jgi:NADH dehydrogenase FAD-containing subunit
MAKRLVLVGGGHAHMVILANLCKFVEQGHKVTVIGPSPYHYYSGMGPGMLGKIYAPEETRFATRHVVEKSGCTFILSKVQSIDPRKMEVCLESRDSVPYDVLSFNAGSFVSRDNVREDKGNIYTVKPIEMLLEAQQRILSLADQARIGIAVVGGGPAALEIAGNAWRLVRDYGRNMPHIQVFAGRRFLSRFPTKVREKAVKSLSKRDIEIIEKGYVSDIGTGKIVLESGEAFHPDLIFLAHGIKPSAIFRDSGLPVGSDGGLLVNRFLQSPQFPEIFGGGDCISFQDRSLSKVGVYAVRQNPVLFHNLMACLQGNPLSPFDPGGDYMLIFNLGDDRGILMKKWFIMDGKAAFMIKDYIDRKFMKRFQAIE